MSQKQTIVGIGEVLIDRFPEYSRLGGAPCNVAYNATVLGQNGICLSATGDDETGREIRKEIISKGLSDEWMQLSNKPSGVVDVTFNEGEPSFSIASNVAWDDIRWNEQLPALAKKTHAVCYSTLAQRSDRSRKTILAFLDHMPESAIKVLDLNLRPPFYTNKIIHDSLLRADFVKVNEEEYKYITEMTGEKHPVDALFEIYDLKGIIRTRGADGSVYITTSLTTEFPAEKVNVKNGDAVGVGDAFISCIILHLLKGSGPHEMMKKANTFAGYVASQKGAIVDFPPNLISRVI
ncbi:MAG: carbohydrate kinase [Balneolales bacterium]|nr:carbohydrate kinase [Balneolales bacterium]